MMTATRTALRSEVTRRDIAAFRDEAGAAGDRAEHAMAERALNGSARAMAKCVARIRAVRAEAAAE